MAIALESFSIREYTAKMRSGDSSKFWPFDGDEGDHKNEWGQAMGRSLPPMSIRKYRWWSDELDAARSSSDLAGGADVAAGISEPMVTDCSGHAEGKKMSVDVDDDGGDGEDEGVVKSDVMVLESMKTTKERIQGMLRKKIAMKYKNIITRKIRKQHEVERLVAEKEETQNQRASSVLYITHLLRRLVNKKQIRKGLIGSAHAWKKKQVTLKNANLGSDIKDGSIVKPGFESEKHDDVDVLKHDTSCGRTDVSQLQSRHQIFTDPLASSSVLEDSSIDDKLPSSTDRDGMLNQNVNGVNSRIIESTVRPLSENEQPSGRVTLDLNYAMGSCNNLNCLNTDGLSSSPKSSFCGSSQILNFSYKGGLCSDAGDQAEESFIRTSNPTNLHLHIGSVSRSDATSTVSRKFVSEPSLSCSETSIQASKHQPQSSVEPKTDSFILERQPTRNFQPEDFTRALSYVDPKKHVTEPFPIHKGKQVEQGFVGLPPSSQGELIKSHSSVNFGFSDPLIDQNHIPASDFSFVIPDSADPKNRTYHVEAKEKLSSTPYKRSKWFPDASGKYAEFNPCVRDHKLVRDIEKSADQDPYLRRSHNGLGEYIPNHDWVDEKMFQPERNLDHEIQLATKMTVRLMGKNVSVGKNSKECAVIYDDNVCTKKEVIRKTCSSVRDEPLHKQWQQQNWARTTSASSSKNDLQTLEAPLSLYRTPENHWSFDCRPQRMSIGDALLSTLDNLPKGLVSQSSKSVRNSISLTESIGASHQVSKAMAHTQSTQDQIPHSSTHSSSTPPTFTENDCWDFVERTPTHSSSLLPQWMLKSKQPKESQKVSSLFSTEATSMTTLPFLNLNASRLCDSPSPASLLCPSLLTSSPVNKPLPQIHDTSIDTIKSQGEKKDKYAYFKLLNRPSITKKRLADRDDEFLREIKRPSLRVHEHSNTSRVHRRREHLLGYTPSKTSYHENPNRNKVAETSLTRVSNGKYGFRTAPASGTLKFDGGSRSSHARLSGGGAKHMPKSNEKMDKDNYWAIRTTIPFTSGSSSGKVSDSQKKPAKLYRF